MIERVPEPTKRDETRRRHKLTPTEGRAVAGLNSKQSLALLRLISGDSITVAAVVADVSRQTLSGWVNSPGPFKTALEDARQQLKGEVSDRIAGAAHMALDTLLDLISSEDERIALEASKAILARLPVQTEDGGSSYRLEVIGLNGRTLPEAMKQLDDAAESD